MLIPILESLQHSEIEEQSFKIDDNLGSSLTEDELDSGFRMVLPVMSHRRKSLEKEKRSKIDKLLSDNGTSSVSTVLYLFIDLAQSRKLLC